MELLFWVGLFIIVMIVINWEAIIQAIVDFIQGLITFIGIVAGVGFLGYIVIAIFKELGAKNVFLTISIIAGILLTGFLLYKAFVMMREYYRSSKIQKIQKKHGLLTIPVNIYSAYLMDKIQELLSKSKSSIDAKSFWVLLRLGADINSKDITGDTPVHKLVKKNLYRETILFLRNGSRLDVKNDQGKLPIDFAKNSMFYLLNLISVVMQKQYEWAKVLIESGANVNIYDDFNNTPMHFIVQNKEEYTVEIISLLLEKGAKINPLNKSGQTPLHMSVLGIPEKTLQVLLDNGADIEAEDKDNRTIAHYVCMKNNMNALSILIKNNIDLDKKDRYGNEPIFYAKLNKNNEMISLIKKHSKKHKKRFWIVLVSIVMIISILAFTFIKFPNSFKNDLFSYSTSHGHFKVADLLLTYGAQVKDANITSMVINNMDINAIKYQIEKQKIDINKQDEKGKTILHYAFEKSNLEIIKFLIKQGAKLDIEDINKNIPCFYSMYNADENVDTLCRENVTEGDK